MIRTAVILAAGISARLNDSLQDKPKGLLKIGNKTLVERSLEHLYANGIEKVIIGTGYLSGQYDRMAVGYAGVTTCKSEHYQTTSSFFTLYNMKDLIQEDFLLLESDLIYEARAISHLLACPDPDVILSSGRTNSQDEVFIEIGPQNVLRRMSKKEEELESVYGELVGISKISMTAFQKVCELLETDRFLLKSIEYEHAFTKLSQSYPLKIEKVEDLIWAEIDTQAHLERVKNLIYPELKELNKKVN